MKTFEVQRPDGSRINVGRTHRQFEELLSWVDAGCYPFLIGPAGSFKTSAAAKVAEALGRPFHMDSMSEGKTPFDLLGFNDATGKAVHTELRRAWEHGGVFLCDEMDAGNANVLDHRERRVRHPPCLDQRREGAAAGKALPLSGGAGAVVGTPQRRGWREGEGNLWRN